MKPAATSDLAPESHERLRPTRPEDQGAFLERYAALSMIGVFRERTKQELAELFATGWIFEIDESPVGSVSLLDRGEWTEVAALSVNIPGKGFGQRMLRKVIELPTGKFLYALSRSPAALDMFEGVGFETLGPLSELRKSAMGEYLPDSLQTYDASNRDPIVMIRYREPT